MNEKASDFSGNGLQVIGTGLPRTGTFSLYTALEILGYTPCHHFYTGIAQQSFPYRDPRLWQQACKTQDRKARQAIIRYTYEKDGYVAGTDYPTSHFVEDLVEMYPNAKFVHGVRSSPHDWRRSFNQTLSFTRSWTMYIGCFMLPVYRMSVYPLMSLFNERVQEQLGAALYGDDDDVELYHRHNEHVRKVVPKDRLLEFNPKDGWEPLCKFLDVAVPTDEMGNKTNYPHTNDTKNIRSTIMMFMIFGYAAWAVVIGLVYITVRYFKLHHALF